MPQSVTDRRAHRFADQEKVESPPVQAFWLRVERKYRMKILVTGGVGFIGSCFVRMALRDASLEIVNVDKLTYAGKLENVAEVADHPRYRFQKADLCEPSPMR
jgi:hypothetical protein